MDETAVTIKVKVLVDEYREAPEEDALRFVEDYLRGARGTRHDWGGKFAIVTDVWKEDPVHPGLNHDIR